MKGYFNTFIIIKAFFVAFALSAFIYFEYFGLHVKLLDSLFAIAGFYALFRAKPKEAFFIGFFIGLFWFYWIALSFRYYELVWLIPLVILGVALIYGTIFYLFARLSPYGMLRALGIVFFSFVAPFGFNWLQFELVLINSYFSSEFFAFAGFIFLIYLVNIAPKKWKILPLLALILLSFYPLHESPKDLPPLGIEIVNLKLDQAKKWNENYKQDIVQENLKLIEKAYESGASVIVFPESAMPVYLNLDAQLYAKLQALSQKITIITGALSVVNQEVLNSTFVFEKGEVQVAHKVILVPFGEQIPLPKFARNFINKIFFNGASDYAHEQNPQDFLVRGVKFRNAICFEATKDALYTHNPDFMIAISNNAWFTPSIEPTLQNLLLRYYAQKYNTIIYHSANAGKSGVIFPSKR
ncbi:MAG: apolipoprotein N-acyltransferase [Sulfurospirillum sp.]|nr:apolipoprotein N-acyltransferase [Sulfurospirillum sp.]